jgi:hypothetical protein
MGFSPFALYQGTTSVVPNKNESTGALAPALCITARQKAALKTNKLLIPQWSGFAGWKDKSPALSDGNRGYAYLTRCHPDGSPGEAEGSAVAYLLRSTPNFRIAGNLVPAPEAQRRTSPALQCWGHAQK